MNLLKQLLAEIKNRLREEKVSLKGGPDPQPGRSKVFNLIGYLGHKIKNLILFRRVVARVVVKYLVTSKIGEALLVFLTKHRIFLISSVVVLTFLVEIFIVQKLTLGQLVVFAFVTFVNLYICEKKYRASGGDVRYLLPMFFFANGLWVIMFFFEELLAAVRFFFFSR
jgi:hypothetical protein